VGRLISGSPYLPILPIHTYLPIQVLAFHNSLGSPEMLPTFPSKRIGLPQTPELAALRRQELNAYVGLLLTTGGGETRQKLLAFIQERPPA